MSKPFLIGILLILVGLMAATSYAVQKQVKPEHDEAPMQTSGSPDDKKKADEEAKRKMAEMSRSKKEQENQMRKQMASQKHKESKAPQGMVIEGDWFRGKQDGQAGIEKALKEESKGAGPGAEPGKAAGPKLSN